MYIYDTFLSLVNRQENTEVRSCFNVPQTRRRGAPPDPHSKPSDPNLPIWAGFLFVFFKFLTSNGWGHYLTSSLLPLAKEHNRLLQERWQAAQLTRNLKAGKYFLALWYLLKDLRPQMAKLLIWKRQKTIIRGQNTTKEMRKRGGKLYWGILAEERYSHRSQSCLGIQTAGHRVGGQGAAVQPAQHGPGPRGPPRMDRDHQHTQPSRCHFLLGQERTRWQKQQVTAQACLGTRTHPCSVTGW